MRQRTKFNKVVAIAVTYAVLLANISVFGQKPAGKPSATQTASAKAKPECKGNYSGVVTYTRVIKTTHEGRYGSKYERNYTYTSNISIRDDGSTQGSIYSDYNGIGGSYNFTGKADATLTETLNDTKISEKDDFCKITLKGAEGKTRVRCESVFTKQTNATGSGNVNVFLGFRGDKYKISLDNPAVSGGGSESSKSSCTGTCGKDTPLNSSRDLTVKGEKPGGTYTDEMPLDPSNINRLSGTFTRPNGDETITITWNLARCAPPMQIDNVRFEHKRFPDPNQWYGVDPLGGTTDGNVVRIKAQVFNNTGATGYATVKFSEAASGEELPDGSVSVAVKPGEARDVEYEWDTSGYAWDENKKPLSARQIKAEIQGGDSVTEKIKILPKPVIMAHGLWSNAGAWADYPAFLRESHSFAWKGYAVGNDPKNGKMNTGDHPGNYKATNTVYQNAQELGKQIKFAREQNNAWHVDIVAHSMGGLISRQYINTFMDTVYDGKPAVSHLVMLGTPNMGSPCADTVTELFESFNQNDMHAMRELRPIIVRAFNTRITEKKGVKFSVLIGAIMPRTCLDDTAWGDGVVPLGSAKYNNTDYAYVLRDHLSLTGREDFDGFVMPRIAIGPKKAKAERAVAANSRNPEDEVYRRNDRYGFASYFKKASFSSEIGDETERTSPSLTTKEKVELAGKESKTIDIAVGDGTFAGVVLAVPLSVSATLFDESGKVAGESKGGMEAMKDLFRTISVKRQITPGTCKLKLENIGSEPVTAFVGGISGNASTSDLQVTAKRSAGDSLAVTAKWIVGGMPVKNAKITASLPGGVAVDLTSGADDVYSGIITKAIPTDLFVEVRAESEGLVRTAIAALEKAVAAPKPSPSKRRN